MRRIVFEASYLVLGLGDVYLGAPCAVPVNPLHRIVTAKVSSSVWGDWWANHESRPEVKGSILALTFVQYRCRGNAALALLSLSSLPLPVAARR